MVVYKVLFYILRCGLVSETVIIKQQMTINNQGVNPPGRNSLMGGSHLSKVTRWQTTECLLLWLSLYVFVAATSL